MTDAVPHTILLAQLEGGGEHAATGTAVEHEEAVPFPPFDATYFPSQLFWLAVTFVTLYLVVMRVALPRIAAILELRGSHIARDLEQAGELKRQSEEANAANERAFAQARAEAFALAGKARDEAKQRAAARQADNEAALNRRLAEVETHIADIKRKALAEVGTVAADVAAAVVETLLGEKPTAAEIKSAVSATTAAGKSDA
jgi:F-type H+-transporting ATPase subunit b